ncbi:aldo/keto reductase [Spongiimicrobium sp. 3-5]|uniref:aldo/keto reductase n=1 Tax=Spongiimicrobium sp. 3-5 TaxID=3332596 RepID=UPI00397F2EBE
MKKYSRREASKLMLCASAGTIMSPSLMSYAEDGLKKRKIPSSGELLPIVGLGTWQSFDVGSDQTARARLKEVLTCMKDYGGTCIDSSPMYGSSERVVGDLTKALGMQDHFFYATKVWTSGRQSGIDQMQRSMHNMGRSQMDLMQIHNLIDWKEHIKTLKDWKERKKIRYWGITHYTNSSHETLAKLIQNEKPDFVQFNYSINQRNAEKRLLGTAHDHGVAVIINRPYAGGSLFRKTRGKSLPPWCKEQEINSWGQFFLKYILAHSAVNLVIPGTSKPHHMVDNLKAGIGRLPDKETKAKMVSLLADM